MPEEDVVLGLQENENAIRKTFNPAKPLDFNVNLPAYRENTNGLAELPLILRGKLPEGSSFSDISESDGLTDTENDSEKENRQINSEDTSSLEPPKVDRTMTPWRQKSPPLSTVRAGKCTSFTTAPLPSLPYDYSSPKKPLSPGLFSNSEAASSSSTAVSTGVELENLRRQLMTYKIKVKALTELIKQSNYDYCDYHNSDGLPSKHIYDKLLDVLREGDTSKIEELKSANTELEEALDDKNRQLIKLKEDLISNKQDYENMLEEVNTYMEHTESVTESLNSMSNLLLNKLDLADHERDALKKACELGPNYLDIKINALSKTLSILVETYVSTKDSILKQDTQAANQPEITSTETDDSSNNVSRNSQVHPEVSSDMDSQLEVAIENMHQEYHSFLKSIQEKMVNNDNLGNVIGSKLSKQMSLLKTLAQSVERISTPRVPASAPAGDAYISNLDDLAYKASRDLSKSYQDHIEALKSIIDRYKSELNDKDEKLEELKSCMKQESSGSLNEDLEFQLRGQLVKTKEQCSQLEHQISELKAELKIADEEKLSQKQQISQVTNRLKYDLDSKECELQSLQKSLKMAVRKSAVYLDENHMLQQKICELEEQHGTLIKDNYRLAQQASAITKDFDSIGEFEGAYSSLKTHLVVHLRKMFKIFENILQQDSVNQAVKKLDNINRLQSLNNCRKAQLKLESIYTFIENATGSIVDEHVKLLLKEKDRRIKRLSQQSQGSEESEIHDQHAKLRIEELTRKWIAERERRKLESDAAIDRISLLEEENALLREKLRTVKSDRA
ncbi:gamma-tubulin complex subunit SPC72 Ecym_5020 [Eremothecium cymbalariae DBVPG|uniref:Mto2p-binding domain-containing protein n=1 Tax=Eremothecium cymbalariae (strain CBS 270.75 / DBVPG 7215 / KCTC 17166 / NRRL Y-17582) TaxID=931890 RepID=I6NCM9_ERECY|nr:hypothetical protein Ecym_5020 [Eremothecium cymbalariae DBVPG\